MPKDKNLKFKNLNAPHSVLSCKNTQTDSCE